MPAPFNKAGQICLQAGIKVFTDSNMQLFTIRSCRYQ